MPIVEVSFTDLQRLARRSISSEDLLKALELMKGEVEEISGDNIVFEASHDRPDLFSAEGFGRALRYLLEVEEPPSAPPVSDDMAELRIINSPRYRPYAYISIVKGVELDDEAIRQLFQLQEKLHATYCRDRALVSIGLYDLDKVKPPIIYTSVSDGRYVPLGYSEEMSLKEILEKTEKGVKYAHLVKEGEYPLLTDSEGQVLSFPPILNAEWNKVTPETKNVIIDVTGTEPHLMMRVLNVVTYAVLERGYGKALITRAKVIGGAPDNPYPTTPHLEGKMLSVHIEDIESLLGLRVSTEDIPVLLKRMGYAVTSITSDGVKVWVPPYRVDVHGVVDIIEDLTISYGYNELPTETLPPTHFSGRSSIERLTRTIRDIMVGLGFNEVVNFMLIDPEILKLVTDEPFITVANPKMKTYSALRNCMLASILIAGKVNSEKMGEVEVFEVGDYVIPKQHDAESVRGMAFLLMGDKYTLTDGLVTAKSVALTLGLKYRFEPYEGKPYIRGRAAKVFLNDVEVGRVGEVHPEILVELGLTKPVVAGEFNLTKILREIIERK